MPTFNSPDHPPHRLPLPSTPRSRPIAAPARAACAGRRVRGRSAKSCATLAELTPRGVARRASSGRSTTPFPGRGGLGRWRKVPCGGGRDGMDVFCGHGLGFASFSRRSLQQNSNKSKSMSLVRRSMLRNIACIPSLLTTRGQGAITLTICLLKGRLEKAKR